MIVDLMTTDGLRLSFDRDDDSTGRLTAEAQSGGFRGWGSAWFVVDELRGFAQALRAYPLSKESPPSIAGGFYFDARLDQVHLALDVYPVGGRGQIGLRIRVGSEVWDRDRPESRHEATIEVLSTYARLERFSREIDDLLSGAASEARLHVEHLL